MTCSSGTCAAQQTKYECVAEPSSSKEHELVQHLRHPYARATRKAFACHIDRAVIRMKDSQFVWPRVNSRLVIPCRIITARRRSLNGASFPFIYCHGSMCFIFPSPIHISFFCVCVCVCVLPDEVVLSDFLFLLWFFIILFFFVLFSRAITACDGKTTLFARLVFLFLCFVQQLQIHSNMRDSMVTSIERIVS